MLISQQIKKQTRVKKPQNIVVYEGESMIDGSPIVGLLQLTPTSNDKIGNMAQLWIMRSDIEPHEAVKTGADRSVCGDCKHRHGKGGSCYVIPHHAPLSVFRSYKNGNYIRQPYNLQGYKLRLGAYGDPTALPENVVGDLVDSASDHTGYFHQWKRPDLRWGFKYMQASVDSLYEVEQLKSIEPNAKYFRVTNKDYMLKNEVVCLSVTKGRSCAECLLCDGVTANVVIPAHGSKAGKFQENAIEVVNV